MSPERRGTIAATIVFLLVAAAYTIGVIFGAPLPLLLAGLIVLAALWALIRRHVRDEAASGFRR